MPNTFSNPASETAYENAIIELFQEMGYTHVYGPAVEGRDFTSPLYDDVLQNCLYKLNSDLPESAIKEALFKLKNFENAELVRKNALFMDYLQNGIPVRYTEKGEPHDTLVYLVDITPQIIHLSLPINGRLLKIVIKDPTSCCLSTVCHWC